MGCCQETSLLTRPCVDQGRREIWQALEAAMKASDTSMAQSILEAANIILPTGNPADGCYDGKQGD